MLDYAGGKMDWLSFDLPHEGAAELVGSRVLRDVPTCATDDTLGGAREAAAGHAGGLTAVTNGGHVVLGSVRPGTDGDDTAPVREAMREGPATVRPSQEVGDLEERLDPGGTILVTRSDGVLVGAFVVPGDGDGRS